MELFFFTPTKIDNGGEVSNIPVFDNIKGNVLPDIYFSESESGLIVYGKIFILPQMTLPFLRIFIDRPSGGSDSCLINIGAEDDTQAEAENYLRWKGSGVLKTALLSGEITTLVVESESEGLGFNPLDLIAVIPSEAEESRDEEFVRIKSISWNGKTATLTLESGSFVDNNYPVGSYISACIERGIVGRNSVWLKEIVPAGSWYKRNNINRVRFIL